MSQLATQLREQGQDFEWYPTTNEMIAQVVRRIPENAASILDIGAGDGRVLLAISKKCKDALLYGIEKSMILVQAQPENIIPIGTNIHEENLSCLEVDYIFCNPIYSEYEEWVCKIIEQGFARKAFLIIPQRWSESIPIKEALKRREPKSGCTVKVLYSGDFHNAERKARAVIDIIEVTFPFDNEFYRDRPKIKDPFDIWFDATIDTFDKVKEVKEDVSPSALARRFSHSSIDEIVDSYREEYRRLETNYRLIFKTDFAILHELGVNKDHVREGLKKKMSGLKVKYWELLFDRLDAITSRLTTASKKKLLEKLTHNTKVEFTTNNAYSVVIWAIKNANQYFDEQLITLFRALSTFDGVEGYKSNEKTWGKDHWRYMRWTQYEAFGWGNDPAKVHRYKLDYRIVVEHWNAIDKEGRHDRWEYPGGLYKNCHEQIADLIAVLSNLGFPTNSKGSIHRIWKAGQWQDWTETNTEDVLFQVKAYMNGNTHWRIKPEAIKALNIVAARLLKWVRTEEEAVTELNYTPSEVRQYFHRNAHLLPGQVKLLSLPTTVQAVEIPEISIEELAEKLPRGNFPEPKDAQQPKLF